MTRENYIGRAGQLAVMAEFLVRGYNVAIPEVDEGDDVLVIRGRGNALWRVQVKTAIGVARDYGYSGQFQVPLGHLVAGDFLPLYYIFALRHTSQWEYVSIAQRQLRDEHQLHRAGGRAGRNVVFYLAFRPGALTCSSRNWESHRNNWSQWPSLLS